MKSNKTPFDRFLAEEVNKYKGVYVPVRTGLLKRMLVKTISCKKLHPNPDDEFCIPSIGPSYEIISRYEHEFRIESKREYMHKYDYESLRDPIIVEQIRPDGYMILNGHHRWAAAVRTGRSKLPAKIVNLTQEKDIMKALQNSSHDRRVTMDLDEVVFEADSAAGKKPGLLAGRLRGDRLRLGIPALFRFFSARGYDVWVYTARYASVDDIERSLSRHRVQVCGVVTGAKRKIADAAVRKRMDELIANKYPITVHIDKNMVLRVDGRTKSFEEFPLDGGDAGWSQEIMKIMEAWKES